MGFAAQSGLTDPWSMLWGAALAAGFHCVGAAMDVGAGQAEEDPEYTSSDIQFIERQIPQVCAG